MRFIKLAICLVTLSISTVLIAQNFRFATIFTDNVVLQQKSKVKIWGYAKLNESIRLNTSWNKKTYFTKIDEDGKWLVNIDTPTGSFSVHSISVTNENNEQIQLKNVLIGEVWCCSGQSNMQMIMKDVPEWNQSVENSASEIEKANCPNIRFITVKRTTSFYPQDEIITDGWKVCEPKTVGDLSAVAYYFARKLQPIINVPIGLIADAYGGSPIQSWIPLDCAMKSDLYGGEIKNREELIQNIVETPEFYIISSLYNAMAYPIINYGIKGWLWYQGESNVGDAGRYYNMMKDLVTSWREKWGKKMPFYYVQIAPFKYLGWQAGKWAELAESQSKAASEIEASELVITSDIGNSQNIHPEKKKPIGERLANIALAQTYGIKTKWRFPLVTNAHNDNGKLILSIQNVYNGLMVSGFNDEFEISADGNTFYKPTIIVKKNSIILSSKEVLNPKQLRYCWNDTCRSNIFNSEKLPLAPFRIHVRK